VRKVRPPRFVDRGGLGVGRRGWVLEVPLFTTGCAGLIYAGWLPQDGVRLRNACRWSRPKLRQF
jgi:hypothetical protein